MTDKDKSKNSSQDVESLTRSTYRAISGDADGDVSFSGGHSSLSTGQSRLIKKNNRITARLPMPIPSERLETQAHLRGAADGAALYRKYHNNQIIPNINTTESKSFYDILEQVRCEAMGARQMKGVGDNLAAALEAACEKKGYKDSSDVPIEDGLYVLAFEALARHSLGDISRRVAHKWRLTIERKIGFGAFNRMFTAMEDQMEFAEAADLFIRQLTDTNYPIEGSDPDNTNEDETTASTEPVDDSTGNYEEEDATSDDEGESTGQMMPTSAQHLNFSEDSNSAADPAPAGGEIDSDQSLDDGSGETAANKQNAPASTKSGLSLRDTNYAIYTTEFDEILGAEKLADANELSALRAQLDKQLQPLQALTSKLANRLQRRLMARLNRRWEYGLEDGILDTSRLPRIIVDPNLEPTYKRETETKMKDTVLTLLIDNSGSMRGRPITIAALTTDILAKTLERAGVKVEILGFTTVNWKGGQSRAQWTQNARPPQPGRLNDVRHIIYKAADAPLRRTRNNIGLMLKEGILKENIDGEALLWAYKRLTNRREDRKILMVISDGAPVDDSTLSSNKSGFLEKDLLRVISGIEEQGNVELTAVGIGHDVSKYYKRAITIRDASDLPPVMMNELANLFDE